MHWDFTFNISNLLEVLVMICSLYGFHRKNVKRIKLETAQNEMRAIDIASKVESRAVENAVRLSKIEDKLDIMHNWFNANVIQRSSFSLGLEAVSAIGKELSELHKRIDRVEKAG